MAYQTPSGRGAAR